MFARIKAFLEGDSAAEVDEAGDPLTDAAAAVLVEAALTDGEFGEDERALIEGLLVERFELTASEAASLVGVLAADTDRTNRLYSATKAIRDGFGEEERVDILEMLWQVAYADGVLHDYEANLVRRVAGLLYVRDQDSGRARKRAMAALNLSDEG